MTFALRRAAQRALLPTALRPLVSAPSPSSSSAAAFSSSAPASAAPRFVLAIDQGTQSSRAMLFDRSGAVVAAHQRPHAQHFPGAARVEHDADEIYARVRECVEGALRAAPGGAAGPRDVAAVGITNQRETLVVWDRRTGAPLHRALVWQDQRGAEACARLAAACPRGLGADRFRAKTGLPLVPYFSASKLAWLLESVPGLRARAEAGDALFGTIDCFLLWRLTGGRVHATDVSNASRTLLFDIHRMRWDEELLAAFGVPAAMLPAVLPSSHVFGECGAGTGAGAGAGASVLEAGARPPTALEGVPVAGILGDQQAALFGQACFRAGDAKNTYGTGCFLLMNTGEAAVASKSGLLTTVAYQVGTQRPVYALEGSVAVGGAVVSWVKDNLGLINSAAESEAAFASVPDSGGCVFVPAFNGLFAPHWRSDARGVLTGLSGHTTRAHVVRAALESVAFQSDDIIRAMQQDRDAGAGGGGGVGGEAPPLRVDGGATANAQLMQFQADISGRAVVRPVVPETTSLGAAYAAGLAVGFWRDFDELRGQWRADRTWEPKMSPEAAKLRQAQWARAVEKSLP